MAEQPAYMKRGQYTQDFIITTDDIDMNGEWKLKSIFTLMQDVAELHCRAYGYGYKDLKAHNLGWVCLRYRVDLRRQPGLFEKVRITTWPGPVRLNIFPRMFAVYDEKDEMVLRASSRWAIIDLSERVMVNPVERGMPPGPDERTDGLPDLKITGRLQKPDAPVEVSPFTPRYSDLDMNGHVNNTRYLEWLVDHMPPEDHAVYRVSEIAVAYRRELRCGDHLDLHMIRDGDRLYFSGEGDEGCYFEIEGILKPRP